MEYQSSTTLGSEPPWNSDSGETEEQPSGAGSESSLPNWRGGYESRPWLFLGLAFTAGCAAAALIPASDSTYDEYSPDYSDSGPSTYSRPKSSYLSETWGKMQSAFIVAATRQAENFLEELVPGFREAYQEQGQSADTHNTSEPL